MAFARFTQPFGLGASRPPSSSGLAFQANAPTSAPRANRSTSRSTAIDLEHPIQAFSANLDGDRVVVAGREFLKILTIGYNNIHESQNLRIPGGQKRNFLQNEVKWSQKDVIATAASNGLICVYKDGKQDRIYQEHHRQVNRLAFNPHDGRFLLSASQDGTVKLWDLRDRDKKSKCTYFGKADAVRDVQFHPADCFIFAAAYDNGTIQRWDFRRDSMCEQRINNAHSGPVFSVDWHPDGKHIASGGRDKTIKVWNFKDDESRKRPKHTLHTQNAVGRVTWRPLGVKTAELASCSIGIDYRIHIWDLKRPYMPQYVLSDHGNSITGLVWKDEDILWSSSRDMRFIQHDVVFGHQPVNDLSHSAFAWNMDNEFTFASQKRKRLRRNVGPKVHLDEEFALQDSKRSIGRSSSFRSPKPTQPISALDNFEGRFVPGQSAARVNLPILTVEKFEFLARHYVTTLVEEKLSVAQGCMRNAKAAWQVGEYRTAKTWRMLGDILEREDEERLEMETQKKDQAHQSNQYNLTSGLVNRRLIALGGPYASASATPLARPVPDTPRSTPTIGPLHIGRDPRYNSENERNEEEIADLNLLVPPTAFGTSLSSSAGSTDGDSSSNSVSEAHAASSSPRTECIETTGTNVYNQQPIAPLNAVGYINRSSLNNSHALAHSHQLPTNSLALISPDAEQEQSMEIDLELDYSSARASASPERAIAPHYPNPHSSNSRNSSPERAGTDTGAGTEPDMSSFEGRPQNSHYQQVQQYRTTRPRQYSIGLVSDQTESSYEDTERGMALLKMKDDERIGEGGASVGGLKNSCSTSNSNLQSIVEEGSTQAKGRTWRDHSRGNAATGSRWGTSGVTTSASRVKPAGLPLKLDAITSSATSSKKEQDRSVQMQTGTGTRKSIYNPDRCFIEGRENDQEAKPWGSIEEVVRQVTEYYMERGDVQFNATLVSLLCRRVKIGGNGAFSRRQLDDWTEAYIDLLHRHALIIQAAHLTKYTISDPLRTRGQTNTFVHTGCCWCGKQLLNSNSKRGFWYCENCKRKMEGCVICTEHVKGSWTMCQICGHGGHDECLRGWYLGEGGENEGLTECPAVGCGHECLPR